MHALVIYDSYFGNTKLIAETIAQELGAETKLVGVGEFKPADLADVDLLILGSPIRGWKPTENTQQMLASLAPEQLKGIKATTFDTRVRLFFHGDAATPMSQRLKELGAEIITAPKSFDVKGKEGPLFEGEIEKAVEWTHTIILSHQKGQTI